MLITNRSDYTSGKEVERQQKNNETFNHNHGSNYYGSDHICWYDSWNTGPNIA